MGNKKALKKSKSSFYHILINKNLLLPKIAKVLGKFKLQINYNNPILFEIRNSENVQLKDPNNQPVNGNWSIDEEKREITFDTPLTESQNYNLTVQNIYDLNLNKIDNYTKYFTAQANTVIDDTKSPEIEIVYQDAGSLIVKFTEDLNPETVNQNSIILKRNGNAVAGTTEIVNSMTLKFITAQSLIVNLDYELTIDPNLMDLANKSVSQQIINFTYVDLPISFYSKQNQRTEISTTAYNNFHLFQGREFDKELDLYYFRNRYLDKNIGIWTTKDPEGYADAYNLYQSFLNNYKNHIDPLGKELYIYLIWKTSENRKYIREIKNKLIDLFKDAGVSKVNVNLDSQLKNREPSLPSSYQYHFYAETWILNNKNYIRQRKKYLEAANKNNYIMKVWIEINDFEDKGGALGWTPTLEYSYVFLGSFSVPALKEIKNKDEYIDRMKKCIVNVAGHEIGHQFNLYPWDSAGSILQAKEGIMRTGLGWYGFSNDYLRFSDIDAYHIRQFVNTPIENMIYEEIFPQKRLKNIASDYFKRYALF